MKTDNTLGRFITLEGGEGAGKSTQLFRLKKSLDNEANNQTLTLAKKVADIGYDAIATREPGGSPGAEEIRNLLVTGDPGRWSAITEVFLHTAARRDHFERTIWPSLTAGRWVLCDRFFDSTMAYQGYGLGVDRKLIETIQKAALGDFRPDLTLILDIDVEIGLRRAATRRGNEDRYERMDVSFHQKLRDGFLDIARQEPDRCEVIDANADFDTVQTRIWAAVSKRFSLIP